MRVKNLFGEYEELATSKKESRIAVEKPQVKDKQAPKKIMQQVYAQPDKKYYTITEVAQLFDIKASMIRYWEEKFAKINPSRSSNGARRYTPHDIETINTVHFYLKVKKYTIEGLRKHMNTSDTESENTLLLKLKNIKAELLAINKKLESTKNQSL